MNGLRMGCVVFLGVVWWAPVSQAATSYTYTCRCLGERSTGRGGCGLRGPNEMSVRVSKKTATTRGANREGLRYDYRFTYDASYRPRGSSTYKRYKGPAFAGGERHLLIESALATGGYALRTGGRGGYLKYEITFDAFESTKYICRR